MGKSLAVYYKSKGLANDRPALDLHFNLWGGFSDSDNESFLDIGLKISDVADIEELDILLPIVLEKKNVTDLGEIIANDSQLLIGIFNENYHVNTTNTLLKGVYSDSASASNLEFYIRQLVINDDTQQNEVDLHVHGKQSIITLNKLLFDSCQQLMGNSTAPIYIRIRVDLGKKKNVFCEDYGPSNAFRRFIINQFQKTHFVDFRVNEKRNIELANLNTIFTQKKGFFNITDFRFFIVRGIEYEYVSANKEVKYMRQLEADLWKKYVFCNTHKPQNLKGLLAHYWHHEPDPNDQLQDFYVFAKYKKSEIHVTYLILFVLFSGLLVNFFYDILKADLLIKFWDLLKAWFFCPTTKR